VLVLYSTAPLGAATQFTKVRIGLLTSVRDQRWSPAPRRAGPRQRPETETGVSSH